MKIREPLSLFFANVYGTENGTVDTYYMRWNTRSRELLPSPLISFPIQRLREDRRVLEILQKVKAKGSLRYAVNPGKTSPNLTKSYNALFIDSGSGLYGSQISLFSRAPIVPGMVVFLNDSFHAYWPLTGRADDAAWLEANKVVSAFFDCSPISNPARLMAIPYLDEIQHSERFQRSVPSSVKFFDRHVRHSVQEIIAAFSDESPQSRKLGKGSF